MKKRICHILLIIFIAAAVLWGGMFVTDYIRCTSLRQPVFVFAGGERMADDGGSGTYQGLGYTVEVEKHIDPEYGACITRVEMKMLGRVIAASIT